MRTFNFFNNVSSSKSLSCYQLAKFLFKQKYKVLIVNFDENSIYQKMVKKWKQNYFRKLINNEMFIPNISKSQFFDLCNIFTDDNYLELTKEDILVFFKSLKEYAQKEKYDAIIFDSSSSFSNVNEVLLQLSSIVLVPINLEVDNINKILLEWFKIKDANQNIHFFISNFDHKNNAHVVSAINVKKRLGEFLLKDYTKKIDTTDSTLPFTLKEIEEDYKNIFKSLKIV